MGRGRGYVQESKRRERVSEREREEKGRGCILRECGNNRKKEGGRVKIE